MRPRLYLLLLSLAAPGLPTPGLAGELAILERPIRYDEERVQLTIAYIQRHYGLAVRDVRIVPQAIVIHWTGTPSLKAIWNGFNRVLIRGSRRDLARGGPLNVSAHVLVGRDGTVYRLMPEGWMARHCIGLNYDSIGIENVGDGSRHPLTDEQLAANAALIRYLAAKHPIRYLIGHFESRQFEGSPLFRERDPTYRTAKADPGRSFMRRLRARLKDLGLLASYKSTQ